MGLRAICCSFSILFLGLLLYLGFCCIFNGCFGNYCNCFRRKPEHLNLFSFADIPYFFSELLFLEVNAPAYQCFLNFLQLVFRIKEKVAVDFHALDF